MCGIAGLINIDKRLSPNEMSAFAKRMADTMIHRGPDDSGVWVDPTGYCAFSQRRLSIIDTSPAGHQPMLSLDGRVCITFNGEIYNYRDLRAELESQGTTFRTKTDTEVLIEMIRRYGENAFPRLDAMYALAFFDTASGELMLSRDPFGEKPLYYTKTSNYLAFASELQALCVLPGFDCAVDEEALAEYFAFQYIHAPRTIYRGARKLPPGHSLRLKRSGELSISRHFRFSPKGESFAKRSLDDLADELGDILIRSVDRRMISDVPLGAFLSGGVDSSAVVALMSKALGRDVQTFSIGFDGTEETEHIFARQMADHLGTEHNEKLLVPDVFSLVKTIGESLDEPNADSSCLPTWLLSKFAREQVTVALSGDGGDEMFGGYGRYFMTLNEEERFQRGEFKGWNPGNGYFSSRILIFPESDLADLLGSVPPQTASLISSLKSKLNQVNVPLLGRMREMDVNTYMPGAVLPKVDRMSMQHSLEVRCPLLSIELARFAEKLSPQQCFADGQGKLVLKQLASRYIPMEWLNRRKMGFGLPTQLWGKEPLLKALRELTVGSDSKVKNWLGSENMSRFVSRQTGPNTFSTYQVWSMIILEIWMRSHQVRHASDDELKAARIYSPKIPPADSGWPPLSPLLNYLNDDLARSAAFFYTGQPITGLFGSKQIVRFYTPRFPAKLGDDPRFVEAEWGSVSWWEESNSFLYEAQFKVAIFSWPVAALPHNAIQKLIEFGVEQLICLENKTWVRYPCRPIRLKSTLGYVRTALVPKAISDKLESMPIKLEVLKRRARLAIARRILRRFAVDAPGPFLSDGGNCFKASLPALRPYANTIGKDDSELLFFEDETLLADRAAHDTLRNIGMGRYVHWELDVYFAPTDNSNPNVLQRHYRYLHYPRLTRKFRKFGITPTKLFHYAGRPERLGYAREIPLRVNHDKDFFRRRFSRIACGVDSALTCESESNCICLVIGSLGPGGAERQLCYLASQLHQRGYSVKVASYAGAGEDDRHYVAQLDQAGVDCDFVISPDLRFSWKKLVASGDIAQMEILESIPKEFSTEVFNLYTRFAVDRPAVVHSFLDHPNLIAAVAATLAGVPRIILSVRNVNPTHFPLFNQPWFKEWYSLVVRNPAVVLTSNSISGAQSYAKWLDIPLDRFTIVHNGLDLSAVANPDERDLLSFIDDFGVDKDAPVICGVFRLAAEKRPDVFLEVVDRVRQEIPNLRVFIAGIGPLESLVKEDIARRNLENCVTLLGRRSDIPVVLSVSNMMLLTSKVEGLPNAIMEAQWFERPVVCSNAGDVRELVIDGVTGYVMQPDDVAGMAAATVRILRSRMLQAQLGKAGRKHIEESFSVGRMVDNSLMLYGLSKAQPRAHVTEERASSSAGAMNA